MRVQYTEVGAEEQTRCDFPADRSAGPRPPTRGTMRNGGQDEIEKWTAADQYGSSPTAPARIEQPAYSTESRGRCLFRDTGYLMLMPSSRDSTCTRTVIRKYVLYSTRQLAQ